MAENASEAAISACDLVVMTLLPSNMTPTYATTIKMKVMSVYLTH